VAGGLAGLPCTGLALPPDECVHLPFIIAVPDAAAPGVPERAVAAGPDDRAAVVSADDLAVWVAADEAVAALAPVKPSTSAAPPPSAPAVTAVIASGRKSLMGFSSPYG
jgi:hypothetical protein